MTRLSPSASKTRRNALLYREFKAHSWSETKSLVDILEGWIFRGQRESSWPLQTSFERAIERSKRNNSKFEKYHNFQDVEEAIVSRFKRSAHHYINDLPKGNLEWISLIQHFSGPTRLLDFTHSFYISVFFAVQEQSAGNGHSAVWAVNEQFLQQTLFAVINKLPSENHEQNRKMSLAQQQPSRMCNDFFEHMFETKQSIPFALPVTPDRTNERLVAQQGMFLCPLDLNLDFEQNLLGAFGNPGEIKKRAIQLDIKDSYKADQFKKFGCLLKIYIPNKERTKILRDLQHMNINTATLFPGLEGLGKSLYQIFENPAAKRLVAKIGQ